MKPKVTLRKIIRPLLLSYAIGLAVVATLAWFGFATGEEFPVKSPAGKDIFIAYGDFIQLAVLVVILAFIASAFSLVVNLIPRVVIIAGSVIILVSLTFISGPSIAILWLAAIVANIALYRGRSRLYVLSLGGALFLTQIFNAWTRTGDVATFGWLVAIDIAFAAPIFYVIFKYIPRQNFEKAPGFSDK